MAETNTTRNPAAASFEQNLTAGFIGLGIALVCLLPPILHFITGPLGPLIGGFFGGARVRAGTGDAIAIGLTIGIGLAVIVGMTGLLLAMLLGAGGRAQGIIYIMMAGILTWGTLLGGLGAYLGGWRERKNPDAEDEDEA